MTIPDIPKPDFSNIPKFQIAVDNTPKVPQKDMVVVPDESTDDK